MIYSMTAYAILSEQGDFGMATWEIRSINHRYLDCSIKTPEIFRQLESEVRLLVQQELHRGRVECSLRFQPGEQSGLDWSLNTSLVKKLLAAADTVKSYMADVQAIDPVKILSWPQVLQTVEGDLQPVQATVLELFKKTLAELNAARAREGEALKKFITDKLHEVLVITAKVKQQSPRIVSDYRAKIKERLAEVKAELDQSRFEQEMVLFAQKVDVNEELERLETHAKEMLRVLHKGGNTGKRLDFLLQEVNRESNTLASKSVDAEITGHAVDLKVLIEQMREQVQNLV